MGGKGSGGHGKGGTKWEAGKVDPTVNSRVMQFGIELVSLPPVDLSSAEAVQERFAVYLRLCDEYGIRPMMASLSQAFKLDRRRLWEICNSDYGAREGWYGLTAETVDWLKSFYQFLQVGLEIYLTEERGNPVKWLFFAKNYFGYEDQTVQVKRTEDATLTLPSAEDVAARYALKVGKPQVIEGEIVQEALPEPPKRKRGRPRKTETD